MDFACTGRERTSRPLSTSNRARFSACATHRSSNDLVKSRRVLVMMLSRKSALHGGVENSERVDFNLGRGWWKRWPAVVGKFEGVDDIPPERNPR